MFTCKLHKQTHNKYTKKYQKPTKTNPKTHKNLNPSRKPKPTPREHKAYGFTDVEERCRQCSVEEVWHYLILHLKHPTVCATLVH